LRHLTETTGERNEELMAEVLIGRDPELQLLERLLVGARAGGACLLVRGAPGAGKSALIDAARRIAEGRRFTVLSCTGVSSEARLPFAGLHELIRPILTQSRKLPAAEREAVQVALGVAAGPVPEVALLGMAVLSLAGSVAERNPVLLIADDVQWLDVRTCEVLAFVGRRLDDDDVVFLATCRDDEADGNPLAAAGLPQLELGPLRPDAAHALLARHAADLDPTVRARILAEAEGNPLALVELPAYDICGGFLQSAINRLRAEGRINHLAQALHTWAWAGVHLGEPAVSLPAAEEARELFSETGQPLWAACAQLVTASVAGRRGDADRAETLTADSERTLLFAGLGPLLAMVCLARGIGALGVGRHTEAYETLARIFDAGDHAHHPHLQAWALTDMIEAALHSGHRDDASELWGKLSAEAAVSGSPLMKIGLLITAPQLAGDDSAGPLFKAAVQADLTAWPLHRARLMLAHGSWLRRRHRVAESRVPLRAARDSLDALGALPWAERARQELTAAGERSLPRAIGALDVLSPQELLIAQLAADGLSNREIGQKLYLSHRTVGSHLYRIFPKLGVASRAELAAAVAPTRAPAPAREPDTVMARQPPPASDD
jgi:DNA-binding CsgD family transcriptional regulator